MRFLILVLILFSISPLAKSQDVHLTQYYTSNVSLNPAYTGNFYGDMKFVLNSRSQWGQISSPIKTNYFSVEKRILRFPDEIGLGVLFVNDQVSAYNLHTNKIIVSGSYQKDFKKNIVRVGLQGGLVFRSINLGSQTFPDQWNYPQGIYDPSIPNGENNLQNSRIYPNFSLGTAWIRRFGAAKVTVGYGLFNLNRPRDGFVPASKGLPFRHVFNSSVTYALSKKVNVIPHFLYMRTARATDFILGSNADYMLNKDMGVLLGFSYRGSSLNSDALIGTAGMMYKRFQFGFSMDFNVSRLSVDSKNKSAWEIMISYTTPSRIPGRVTLPCDRY